MIQARTSLTEQRFRSGFALVELLVSMAIIGILVALLMPAVQSSRETARRAQCSNHLKQIGIAMMLHEGAYRHFPTGGWGYRWVGDPKRGVDKRQPGGWIFNLLPYLEQTQVHDIGEISVTDAELRMRLADMCRSPIPIFNCPSRRATSLYPSQWQAFNTDPVQTVAKSDYAANAGSVFLDVGAGPVSLAEGDSSTYAWPTYDATGICYQRSQVRVSDITDGTSHTILVGEKNLPRERYSTGDDRGDDQSMYSGDDFDTLRWANAAWLPINDKVADYSEARFGSAHVHGVNLLLCDGAVRHASYNIDRDVYEHLGGKSDGAVVGEW